MCVYVSVGVALISNKPLNIQESVFLLPVTAYDQCSLLSASSPAMLLLFICFVTLSLLINFQTSHLVSSREH